MPKATAKIVETPETRETRKELLESQVRLIKREGLRLCQIIAELTPNNKRCESALGSIRAGVGIAIEELRGAAERFQDARDDHGQS